jgi:hypothetical protein
MEAAPPSWSPLNTIATIILCRRRRKDEEEQATPSPEQKEKGRRRPPSPSSVGEKGRGWLGKVEGGERKSYPGSVSPETAPRAVDLSSSVRVFVSLRADLEALEPVSCSGEEG